MEILCVRDTKATHSMLMPPLFEVPLKSSPTPIATVSTDLTVELLQTFSRIQVEKERH